VGAVPAFRPDRRPVVADVAGHSSEVQFPGCPCSQLAEGVAVILDLLVAEAREDRLEWLRPDVEPCASQIEDGRLDLTEGPAHELL
jgi:hypothetical protein